MDTIRFTHAFKLMTCFLFFVYSLQLHFQHKLHFLFKCITRVTFLINKYTLYLFKLQYQINLNIFPRLYTVLLTLLNMPDLYPHA